MQWPAPVKPFHLTLGGFDTHANQKGQHGGLDGAPSPVPRLTRGSRSEPAARHCRSYLLYRLNSSTAFVPPNPKLLLMTASTRTSRGLLGT